MQNDEIFPGMGLQDLFKKIYDNSNRKDKQVKALIRELQPLVKSVSDATIIIPLIKEYLDISVRNDDHMIKLAAIVQRLVVAENSGASTSELLSEEELAQLQQAVDFSMRDEEIEEPENDVMKQVETDVDEIRRKLVDGIGGDPVKQIEDNLDDTDIPDDLELEDDGY